MIANKNILDNKSNNHLQYTREKNEWDKKEGEKRSVELDSKKERNILLNSKNGN